MSKEIEHYEAREAIAEYGRELAAQNLTKGTGGNVSSRTGDSVAINPSGIAYEKIEPADVPIVDVNGQQLTGDFEPSSETPMHTHIYRNRDDVHGIVHAHAPYATAFAMTGEEIPPSNYLVAYLGDKIPVAAWEQPGSEALGQKVVDTLGQNNSACLLQNHGLMAVGTDLEDAFNNALITELCAQTHYMAEGLGDPIILSEEDIDQMIGQFEQYRQLEK
jgi:L-fuculose-phosphate aldolase